MATTGASASPDSRCLSITYNGVTRWLTIDDDLRVGRGTVADLRLADDNRFVHRRFVRVWCDDTGHWHLSNEGTRLVARNCDDDSPAEKVIAPGRDEPITYLRSTLRVRAAQHDYSVALEFAAEPPSDAAWFTDHGFPGPAGLDDAATLTRSVPAHNVNVHGDHLRLVLALAEARLNDRHSPVKVPTRAQLAHRFGWTVKAVDRKLDKVCQRFANAGVAGLQGEIGLNATDRMTNLVTFVVDAGIVRHSDLAHLDTYA